MATRPLGADSARVITPIQFPNAAAGRIAQRLLAKHSAHEIGEAITVLIDVLDLVDGDADLEGECSEDEVSRCTDAGAPVPARGPGCDIADPGGDHANEDDPSGFARHWPSSPGCSIADPGGCQHDGREPDDWL